MFNAHYDRSRFRFIHSEIMNSGIVSSFTNQFILPKTAVFLGEEMNLFIDTSDGVNEDLQINEYCGRIKKVIQASHGKKFLYFKSAYSPKWVKNIESLANSNNGKVIPFFKWSFNNSFYDDVLGKKEEILERHSDTEKIYDIGVFFDEKEYTYPKPSEVDPLISWEDHQKFGLPGQSRNTGKYVNNSRADLIQKLKQTDFKILNTGLSYSEYIKASFACKVIINPPGIGEYTSRMVDQTYLGNCIVLRKNTYDNANTWKNHIPEVDFKDDNWKSHLGEIISDHEKYASNCAEYYESFWSPQAIVQHLVNEVKKSEEQK